MSAAVPRAISPISIPRDGSSTGRLRPDRGATQRPSMKHLSASNQVSFEAVIYPPLQSGGGGPPEGGGWGLRPRPSRSPFASAHPPHRQNFAPAQFASMDDGS